MMKDRKTDAYKTTINGKQINPKWCSGIINSNNKQRTQGEHIHCLTVTLLSVEAIRSFTFKTFQSVFYDLFTLSNCLHNYTILLLPYFLFSYASVVSYTFILTRCLFHISFLSLCLSIRTISTILWWTEAYNLSFRCDVWGVNITVCADSMFYYFHTF